MVQNRSSIQDKLLIRKMREADVEQAAQIEKLSFSVPWSQEGLRESLLNPRTLYLAAEYEGQVVGECGVHFACGEGEITNVAVLPQFRACGIGKALLAELLRQGEALGIREFTLEVRAGNTPAIGLYEQFGFRTEGIRKNFYEKPQEDAMIMWKRQEADGTITT